MTQAGVQSPYSKLADFHVNWNMVRAILVQYSTDSINYNLFDYFPTEE